MALESGIGNRTTAIVVGLARLRVSKSVKCSHYWDDNVILILTKRAAITLGIKAVWYDEDSGGII